MTFYSGLAQTAKRLIDTKGRSVTVRSTAGQTFDPINDTMTGGVTNTPVKAVFTEFKREEIDGTLIMRGDKKVLLAGSVEPKGNDVIIDGSTKYRIVDILTVQPADTVVIYKVQARK